MIRLSGRLDWVEDEPIEFEDQAADEVRRREAICRACSQWDSEKGGCSFIKPCARHDRTRIYWQRGSCRLGKWLRGPSAPIRLEGRGIVTTAGGPLYFLNAYLNFALLREAGCRLPIEWAYMGEEMQPAWIEAAQRIPGIRMIDLGGGGTNNAKGRGGWQSKIRAIQASSFQEVLFLDADSFPRSDPAFLFDHPAYSSMGAVLWADVCDWEPARTQYINDRFGVSLPAKQVESGQLLFDKARAAELLAEVARLHQVPDLYQVIFGDKDSWLIAALRTKTPYRLQTGLGFCRGGLHQPDLDGKPFFAHLTNGKFQWKRAPKTDARAVPMVARVAELQQELIDFLGGVPTVANPNEFSREDRRALAVGARR